MGRDVDAVFEAIGRWQDGGLIESGKAAELRAEAARHAKSHTRRLSQYLVAATGGAVLLIAGGVFLDWAWELLDRAGRATLLGLTGIAVLMVGVRLEGRGRWRPASYLMQTSGLGLLLAAFAYTETLWEDQSPGSIAVGVIALGLPIVLAPRAMRRSAVMPAVHLAFGLAFFAVFLDRATGMSAEAIVWTLDALLVASIAVLVRLVLRDPAGARHPWALNAFVTAMFGGFVMITWTCVEIFSINDEVIYPLDAWLGVTVALTLWGRHRGPSDLRREWFGTLLAWLGILWIFFGFVTAYELGGGADAEMALLLVGGAGAAQFVYGNSEGLRTVMVVGTISFVLALWVWAVDRGGALGAVLALAATAALLFWVSGRIGGSSPTGSGEPSG